MEIVIPSMLKVKSRQDWGIIKINRELSTEGYESGEILAPALKELGRPEGQNIGALVALCG